MLLTLHRKAPNKIKTFWVSVDWAKMTLNILIDSGVQSAQVLWPNSPVTCRRGMPVDGVPWSGQLVKLQCTTCRACPVSRFSSFMWCTSMCSKLCALVKVTSYLGKAVVFCVTLNFQQKRTKNFVARKQDTPAWKISPFLVQNLLKI